MSDSIRQSLWRLRLYLAKRQYRGFANCSMTYLQSVLLQYTCAMISVLQQLGLSRDEEQLYLSLLQEGALLIAAAAQKAGVHRPAAYRALNSLVERGLVTATPRGKRLYYTAESPQLLQPLFTQLTQQYATLLPDLAQLYSKKSTPVIRFLPGREGMRFVMNDVMESLPRGGTYYRYSSRRRTTADPRLIPRDFAKRRDAKQIQRYVITSEKLSRSKKPELNRHIKVIPAKYDLFQYDVSQLMYENKVAYLDYNSMSALIIENPVVATFQRRLFLLLFNLLPAPSVSATLA
jgi:predicted transcriptional regulator